MLADNFHHVIAAAQRRAQQTRQRAVTALRRMDATGQHITFDTVAGEAGVSRSWLYAQDDLRAEIEQLRQRHPAAPSAPVPPPAATGLRFLGRHYAAWAGRQGRKTVITPMTRKVALSFIVFVLAATGCTAVVLWHRVSALGGVAASAPARPIRYLGVITPVPTTQELNAFAVMTGVHPDLDEYYVQWGQPFSRVIAGEIASAGALPMISWEPFTRSTTLAAIAGGQQDAYITSWARAIAAYHHPIALSFAAEMNGYWEDWGPGHATAAQFVSAWRRIHNLFAAAGATNVTWVWTVNNINGMYFSLRPYWPGAAYVNWIGIDGYWWGSDSSSSSGLTFSAIFAPTVAQVRQFTTCPVLIAETGGAPGYKVTAIRNLFAGVEHTPGMLGFVWFNIYTRKADWRLQDSPAALAAYQSAAKNSR
jgi:hypothetical protein